MAVASWQPRESQLSSVHPGQRSLSCYTLAALPSSLPSDSPGACAPRHAPCPAPFHLPTLHPIYLPHPRWDPPGPFTHPPAPQLPLRTLRHPANPLSKRLPPPHDTRPHDTFTPQQRPALPRLPAPPRMSSRISSPELSCTPSE